MNHRDQFSRGFYVVEAGAVLWGPLAKIAANAEAASLSALCDSELDVVDRDGVVWSTWCGGEIEYDKDTVGQR